MWWQTTNSQKNLYFTLNSFFMNNLNKLLLGVDFTAGGLNQLQSIHSAFAPNSLRIYSANFLQCMRDHIRNFFDVVDKLEEMERCIINDFLAILLLYSIPDEYENFRIAIETLEKLPQLEALKIKLLEEYEARKRNSKENVSDAMFISKNPGRSSQPKKSEDSKTQRFKFACHRCGKIGHIAKDCRSKLFKPKNPKTKPTESTRKAEVVMKLHVEHDKRWCLDSGASSHTGCRIGLRDIGFYM
jgi:hypothetical protein